LQSAKKISTSLPLLDPAAALQSRRHAPAPADTLQPPPTVMNQPLLDPAAALQPRRHSQAPDDRREPTLARPRRYAPTHGDRREPNMTAKISSTEASSTATTSMELFQPPEYCCS
ncbi:hypothetical protein LINPERPRIM_LOCUS10097, partial [Linum perenne]